MAHVNNEFEKKTKTGVDTPTRLLLPQSGMTEEAALDQLREVYRGIGLEVRFYPECISVMRWQLGRNGDGEHFTLMAYGETAERLIECLKARVRSMARNGH